MMAMGVGGRFLSGERKEQKQSNGCITDVRDSGKCVRINDYSVTIISILMFKFKSIGIYAVTLCLLLALSHAFECNFDRFISQFNKNYAAHSAEYHYRQTLFNTHCQWINTVNNDPLSPYTLDLTRFADLTELQREKELNLRHVSREELRKAFGSGDQRTKNGKQRTVASTPTGSSPPPTSLNYSALGKVTSIKNQGSCGCCWAFSSIATYESWLLIKGHNFGLSEEAVLQCTSLYSQGRRPSNCTIGYLTDAMVYLGKVGGVLRSNYPYISGSISSGDPALTPGICSDKNRIYLGNGTMTYDEDLTTAQIKQKLFDSGPLMVGIYADSGFSAYSTGVYSGCPANSSSLINHAVQLIGYDSSNNWIIKNQWGTAWGVNGFMTVSNSRDCGLANAIIGMDFTSFNSNPSVSFDPTVYVTPVNNWEQNHELYQIGILAILAILMIILQCHIDCFIIISPYSSRVLLFSGVGKILLFFVKPLKDLIRSLTYLYFLYLLLTINIPLQLLKEVFSFELKMVGPERVTLLDLSLSIVVPLFQLLNGAVLVLLYELCMVWLGHVRRGL